MIWVMYLLINMKIGYRIEWMGKISVLQPLFWDILLGAPWKKDSMVNELGNIGFHNIGLNKLKDVSLL